LGKFVGAKLYGAYWELDPGSYRNDHWLTHDHDFDYPLGGRRTPKPKLTPEQEAAKKAQREREAKIAAKKKAMEDGRTVGSWMGFLLGALLIGNKTYDIYRKSISNL
jgi:hypothetical protein